MYHNVKTPAGVKLDPYALYVIVEKGQLKVVHVFGNHSTSVTVGEGLNRDEWHSVMVSCEPQHTMVTVQERKKLYTHKYLAITQLLHHHHH